MKRILLLLLLILSVYLYSETKTINKITIEGLKRTNISVVEDILKVKVGDPFCDFIEEDFQ